MDNIGTWIRAERMALGLSTRELGRLSGVAYPTISRIENHHELPRWDTLNKLVAALGKTVEPIRAQRSIARLSDLAEQWDRTADGTVRPDWTMLRAFADELHQHPERTAAAIMPALEPSGSPLVDNLLAATAEKLADDAHIRRPAWTARFPALREVWYAPGTPSRRAEFVAHTPEQFLARNLVVPETAIWRARSQVQR